jgi:membrane protein
VHGQASPDLSTGSPSLFDLSVSDWKPIFVRAVKESFYDNLALIAAGAAFYAFTAMVPLLASVVLIYGIAADPGAIAHQVGSLATVLPESAAKLIGDEMQTVVLGSNGKKGLGLVLALALSLFWARNGAAGVITALSLAYEREETRGTLYLTLLALLMTLGAIVAGGVVVGAIVVLTALGSLVQGIGTGSEAVLKVATYIVLLLAGMATAATLYRYAPDGAEPRWQWVTPGSVFCGLLWVVLTLGFGFYVKNFGNYDATYGSLSAVVVLLTLMWLAIYVLLVGAEINWVARAHAAKKA